MYTPPHRRLLVLICALRHRSPNLQRNALCSHALFSCLVLFLTPPYHTLFFYPPSPPCPPARAWRRAMSGRLVEVKPVLGLGLDSTLLYSLYAIGGKGASSRCALCVRRALMRAPHAGSFRRAAYISKDEVFDVVSSHHIHVPARPTALFLAPAPKNNPVAALKAAGGRDGFFV